MGTHTFTPVHLSPETSPTFFFVIKEEKKQWKILLKKLIMSRRLQLCAHALTCQSKAAFFCHTVTSVLEVTNDFDSAENFTHGCGHMHSNLCRGIKHRIN